MDKIKQTHNQVWNELLTFIRGLCKQTFLTFQTQKHPANGGT